MSTECALKFSVTGPGAEQLKGIRSDMDAIHNPKSGGGNHSAGGAMGGLAAVAGKLGPAMSAASTGMGFLKDGALIAMQAFEKMGEVGHGLVGAGASVLEAWGGVFGTLIEKAGHFEQMLFRIQSAGKTGAEAQKIMKDSIKFTSTLPLTESDVVRTMTTLTTAHIDGLKQLDGTYAQLAERGKTLKDLPKAIGLDRMAKEGPNAVSVIADMLAATENLGTAYQGMAIHEYMLFIETGLASSMKAFAQLKPEFRELRKNAKTAEERLKGMMDILAKHGALGVSQAAMHSLGGVMSNFKGLIDKVTVAIMEPGKEGGVMDRLVTGFQKLYGTVNQFFDEETPKGKKFLHTMHELFGSLGESISWVIDKIAAAIQTIGDFATANPEVVKFAAYMSIAVAITLIAVGVFFTVVAALFAFAVAAAAAVVALAALPIIIGLVVGLLSVMTGAVFLASGALGTDFAQIRQTFEDTKLVVSALFEAFQSWGSGVATISGDTARALEERGLMGTFLKIGHYIREAQVFWEGFSSAISARWESIKSKWGQAFDNLWQTFVKVKDAIMEVFGVITGGFNTTAGDIGKATSAGEAWGNTFADVLQTVADLAERATSFFKELVGSREDLMRGITNIVDAVYKIKNDIQANIPTVKLFWAIFEYGGATAMKAILRAKNAVSGLGTALKKVASGDLVGASAALYTKATEDDAKFDKYISKAYGNMVKAGADMEAAQEQYRSNEYDREELVKRLDDRATQVGLWGDDYKSMPGGAGSQFGTVQDSAATSALQQSIQKMSESMAAFSKGYALRSQSVNSGGGREVDVQAAPVVLDGREVGSVIFKAMSKSRQLAGFLDDGEGEE